MYRFPLNDGFNDEEIADTEVQYTSSRYTQQENVNNSTIIDHEQRSLISSDYESTTKEATFLMSSFLRSERFNDEEIIEAEVKYSSSWNTQQENVDNSKFIDYEQQSLISADYSMIPDILQLIYLCANVHAPANSSKEDKMEATESWEPIREWLVSHNPEEIRRAAAQRLESGKTALHFVCQKQPPIDVIDILLSIAPETVQWPDAYGWLPIHYASAFGAQTEVVKSLADAFPECKTSVDDLGLTPLHLALRNINQNLGKLVSPAVVAILSSSGAAAYADNTGMLPLHYACAYGASLEVLYVLTGAHNAAITTRDQNNRTPLHFALSNAGLPASPGAVRHLLELDTSLANSNGGALPLRVLAEFAHNLKNDIDINKRANVQKCLEHLLNVDPDPTVDFFTALQLLPDWLQERAVVIPKVQVLLNDKISQRFPTFVLMGDLYFLALIIISYSLNVTDSIVRRSGNQPNAISGVNLSPLYLGASYFLSREIIQMISLMSLKSFHIWVYDVRNWLNVIFIILVLYWSIVMHTGGGDNDRFRYGTAFTVIVLWLKVLAFLRNMLIDFAVLIGGVLYVIRRLVAFLTALMIILVGFAQMFVTVYQNSDTCENAKNSTFSNEEDEDFPYCNYWTAFLNVYTMLLGQVGQERCYPSPVATLLFIIFMFLVVIFLANVLIAIITDSYKVIQDQRAAIVFWTNRLDFVAEMDAIVNGPWKQRIRSFFGIKEGPKNTGHVEVSFGKEFWKRLMDLFEDDFQESIATIEFWAYNLLRVFAAFVIIPSWIILGILSAGWFWPPQLREAIFTSTVSKHSSELEREDELRKTQVIMVQKEVEDLQEDMFQELKVGRIQIVQMKSSVADRRAAIANEMKHIKRIVTMLFDQQAAL